METRAGGFDGLLVASWMDVVSLLGYLVPFIRGSGQVAVWRGEREGLVGVVDACGKEKKGEWLRRKERGEVEQEGTGSWWEQEILGRLPEGGTGSGDYLLLEEEGEEGKKFDITKILAPWTLPDLIVPPEEEEEGEGKEKAKENSQHTNSHPRAPKSKKGLDPTLLLAPTIHSTKVRTYQVLPGRTHPVMTSKGGAEGYVFVATRVVPVPGKVEAMGKGGVRRRAGKEKRGVDGGEGGEKGE